MLRKSYRGCSLLFIITTVVLWYAPVLAAPVQNAATVAIKALKDTPQQYLDSKITIKGKLKLVGDYWGVHEFVVEDEQGNQVPVMPWAPGEIMKSPIEEIQRKAPKTMGYYIGKDVSVMGTFKSRKKYRKLEHYIDTEFAEELAK